MTADWVRKGERVHVVHFARQFDYEGEDGWGFSFPCDERGEVEGLPDEARSNWAACLVGNVDGRRVVDRGVQRFEHSYWEPGVLRCRCGAEVVVDMALTNTCGRCGRDYSSSGQLLAPREQWGEDTGETASDVLMADRPLR